MQTALRHWHPVYLGSKLGPRESVGIKLCGQEIVLSRDEDGRVAALAGGRVAALADRCAHGQMRLSQESVADGRVVCGHHGRSFDPDGNGRSPGTPDLEVCRTRFDVAERYGALWVKREGTTAAFPEMDFPDVSPLEAFHFRVRAAFERLVDHMVEREHTERVHTNFGVSQEDLSRVETWVASSPDQVDTFCRGPQRPMPYLLALASGIRPGDEFVQYATVRFGPVHTHYDLLWMDRRKGPPKPFKLRLVIFYNPTAGGESEMFAFVFTTLFPRGRLGFNRLLHPILLRTVARELQADVDLIEGLDGVELSQHRLGRFDRPLQEVRKRIEQLYYGERAGRGRANAVVADEAEKGAFSGP